MSKKLLIGICVVLLALMTLGYYGYTRLIEAGYPSCVLSIEEVIRQEFEKGTIKGLIVTNEWQTLDEDSERTLFNEFHAKGLKFDCRQFPQFADGSALIGEKGHIRFRREGSLIRVLIESDENHERPY